MSATRAWLLRKMVRRRLPNLDDALLTERGVVYTWFRLALVYQRAILRTLVHSAELWLMAREFPFEFAAPLFTIRATFALGSGLVWGPLEALRRRVREELRGHSAARAQRCIEAFLVLATLLGLVPLLVGGFLISQAGGMAWTFDGLYGSYFLICALGFLIELRARTLHAGVFALGRVYRSTLSVLGPDLLETVLLFSVWEILGPFALGAALLVTSPLRAGLTGHYAHRAYRIRRVPRPSAFRIRSLSCLAVGDLNLAARGLLSAVPAQLDRLLLVVLLGAPPSSSGLMPLAAPYYAFRPLASVVQTWARAYYADLVRLDNASISLLRLRFERLLRRAQAEAAVLAFTSLVLGAWLLLGVTGALASLWFMPLLMVRSHLAIAQFRAIAYERDDAILRISALMTLVLAAAALLKLGDRQLIMTVAAGLAIAALAIGDVGSEARRRAAELWRRPSLAAWLGMLSNQTAAVRLHVVRVNTSLARPSAVVRRLQTEPRVQRVATFGRAWLLWWEDAATALDRPALAALLSGTCVIHQSCDGATGALALDAAQSRAVFPRELHAILAAPAERDAGPALSARFTQLIPDGHTIDLFRASTKLAELSHGELALVRRALAAEARELQIVPRKAPWQVAVYAPSGEVRIAYVWPAQAPGGAEFRRAVLEESWRQSLPRHFGHVTS